MFFIILWRLGTGGLFCLAFSFCTLPSFNLPHLMRQSRCFSLYLLISSSLTCWINRSQRVYIQNSKQKTVNVLPGLYQSLCLITQQYQIVGIMIETKCQIAAPISLVRQILLDFQKYPEWNPFIVKVLGVPVVKEQIHVDILLPGDTNPNHFDPHVLVNSQNEFRWIGLLCCSCCFSGEHYFLINEVSPNKTEFTHGQEFSGCLRPLFFCLIESKTIKGFQLMNEALKKRAEEKLTIIIGNKG